MTDEKDKTLQGKDAILQQEADNASVYAINAHDEQRSLEKVAENEAHLTTGDVHSHNSPIHGDARDAAQGEPESAIERYSDEMCDKAHVDARYLDPQIARSGPGAEIAPEAEAEAPAAGTDVSSNVKEELGGVIGALGSITGLQTAAKEMKAAGGDEEILSPNNHKLFGAGGDFARQKKASQEAPPLNWDPAKDGK